MKATSVFILSMAILFILTGCEKEPGQKAAPVQQQPATQQAVQGTLGKVVEKLNDGEGYTFVLIDSGKTQFWAAAPEFQVSVGSMVMVPDGTRMTNFHNKPLNRNFDTVMFVDIISPVPSGPSTASRPAGPPVAATPSTAK